MKALFPLLAVILWSSNIVVNKMAVGAIAPGAISFYRWLLAALLLTPFCLPTLIRHWLEVRRNLLRLLLLSLLGMVLFQCLAYFAAQTTTATNIGVLIALVPVLTLLFGGIFLRNRISTGGLLGAVVSLAGVIALVSQGDLHHLLAHGLVMGDALMLIAVICYAIYNLLLKHWKMAIPVWVSLYSQVLCAVILLLPVLWSAPSLAIHGKAWGLIAYAGVLASLAAPYLWIHGIQLLGASRASIFMNLIPILSAILAIFTLGERLTFYHWLGGALTLFGVLISQLWVTSTRKRSRRIFVPSEAETENKLSLG